MSLLFVKRSLSGGKNRDSTSIRIIHDFYIIIYSSLELWIKDLSLGKKSSSLKRYEDEQQYVLLFHSVPVYNGVFEMYIKYRM